ncbi:MAG: TonB family protein [Gemmatimonadaceae bacterium]
MKSARFVWTLAAALGALMSVRSSASAQLVSGVVRDKANGAPIKRAKVQLLPDTGTTSVPLANTVTDSSGVFYLDVPTPGRYRLVFATLTSTFFSDPFPVTTGDVQHEFMLDVAGAQPYFEFQVEKQVRVRDAKLIYPPALRSAGVEGEVLAQFVVDTLGRAEMWTFRLLKSTNPAFTSAVRVAVPQIRFIPAEARNQKVRQLVQMPFFFHFGQQASHDTTSLPSRGIRAEP